jgi:mRNA-degrading endonuclease toxin of MazEF toxin-antitoxin module
VPTLGRGRIILAEVNDPQGQNRKPRPLVIVTPTEDIREGERFVAVAVSSTFPCPVPDDYVELPYHPEGHPRTGLKRRSAAVCSWREGLTHADVIRDIGRVPDRQMLAILEKVKNLGAAPPPASEPE